MKPFESWDQVPDPPKPSAAGQFSEPIASEKIITDRKIFFIDLKENNRGRFLKITEDVAGRRDTILLPVEALGQFCEALARLMEFEAKL